MFTGTQTEYINTFQLYRNEKKIGNKCNQKLFDDHKIFKNIFMKFKKILLNETAHRISLSVRFIGEKYLNTILTK